MTSGHIPSPLGDIRIVERDGVLVGLDWRGGAGAGRNVQTPLLAQVRAQLGEYFAGQRRVFDLPLRVDGSGFQRAVCDAMSAIPFGDTRTYGDIAADLGASAQAVGNACGGNPIP
ncbi:MAG TPA: methylated-DNA--[protein]-cysteine S-methyltransferase, partial [Aliiroseovarius sp.]|nr:methylated-DNA--[protein]-cysteine S-methyltransferase [Aliiroseovarius sp.]